MKGSFALNETLSCGCRLRPLEGGDRATELLHQKDQETLGTYNRLFFELFPRFRPQHITEIGVYFGGSLAMWHERFGCFVMGVDLEHRISGQMETHMDHAGIGLTVGDATDASLWTGSVQKTDLVIDDGSHRFKDILATFGILWRHLNSGGLYVIEDWRSDEGCYAELARHFLSKLIGYWPDKGLPADAPGRIFYFRDLIVLEKQ